MEQRQITPAEVVPDQPAPSQPRKYHRRDSQRAEVTEACPKSAEWSSVAKDSRVIFLKGCYFNTPHYEVLFYIAINNYFIDKLKNKMIMKCLLYR